VLTVLNKLLKVAVGSEAIERMPCTIRLLPLARSSAAYHGFDEYEWLVQAARSDPDAYLIVLLGGEAGLRCGEMMALERTVTCRSLCDSPRRYASNVSQEQSSPLLSRWKPVNAATCSRSRGKSGSSCEPGVTPT
jgi:hypothetical protein